MAIKGFLEPDTYTVVENIQMYQPKNCNLQFNVITYADETKEEEIHSQVVLCYDLDVFAELFSIEKTDGKGANLIKNCYRYLKTRPGFGKTEEV